MYGLAALSGLAMGLSFSPIGWWPLAFAGVAGFALSVRGLRARQAMLAGYLFGLAMFVLTISYVYVLGWWVGALLVAVMSLYSMGLGAIQRVVQRLPGWPVWLACTWSLTEFCWSRFPLGGFGWTRLAFTTPDQPLGGWLPIIGAPGTSWIVAAVGAALAYAVVNWPERKAKRVPLLVSAGLVVLAFVAGAVSMSIKPGPGSGQVSVGVVQGNVDGNAGPHAMGYARSVTNNHLSETITLMAKARTGLTPMPDFVLWPENSSDLDPTKDAETRESVNKALDISQRPVFVGAIMRGPGPGQRQTSGLWYTADGTLQDRYDKRNAVPFGEYTPMRKLVFALVPLARNVGAQTVPGTEPGVLNASYAGKPLRLGDIICYELAFDNTIYDTARNHPEVVVVQSNNASYTGTAQPKQQFTITRVRAMEMRREVVVSTTSSFSGLIDARGKIIAHSQEGTAASETFTVPRRDTLTLGVQLGPWLELVASGIALVSVAAGLLAARQQRAKVTQHE